MHRGPGVPVVFRFVSVHTYMYPCCCYVFELVSSFVIMCSRVVCLFQVLYSMHGFIQSHKLLLECNLDYLVVVQVIFCNGSDLLNSIFILFLFSSWKSFAFVLYSSLCWFCFSHSTSLFQYVACLCEIHHPCTIISLCLSPLYCQNKPCH